MEQKIHQNLHDGSAIADETDEGCKKPFLDHLEDLRVVFLKSLIAIFISTLVSFFFADYIIAFFKGPLAAMAITSEEGQLIESQILRSLAPADFLMASLKLSFIVGIILVSPLVCYWFWKFVSPGLTHEESQLGVPVFIAGLICFLAGSAFCYFVILKLSLTFLWNYAKDRGVDPLWTFNNYLSFVSTMMLSFGLTFELPVVTALLTKLGLLSKSTLVSKRRYAYLLMLILAAIFTPPDVVSQIMLCVPMLGLFELSIWIAGLIESNRAKE